MLICGSASAGSSNGAETLARRTEANSLVGTSLKCAVQPPGTLNYQEYYCGPSIPSNGYTIAYKVFAPAGGQYSYQWQVPHVQFQGIAAGCTATTNFCTLKVPKVGRDVENEITVTVTDLSNGARISSYADYSIPATCIWVTGYVWC